MKAYLARLLPQFFAAIPAPSVDAALAHFNSALTGLRAAKAHHDGLAAKAAKAVEVAKAAAQVAEAEAVRAARAIAKIEDFII